MQILIVDDEALARQRLHQLLAQDTLCGPHTVQEASTAAQALTWLQSAGRSADCLVLLDVHMPGLDGIGLAAQLQRLHQPPAFVFVTADAGHALEAFELEAVDYLTKPVRLPRLQQALQRVLRAQGLPPTASHPPATPARLPTQSPQPDPLVVQGRLGAERIPWAEVLYLRAEQKYLTLRTLTRSHILEGALLDWESRMSAQWLRIHRNTLVSRTALRALERLSGNTEGDTWAVRLQGLSERLPVSRRQLAAVRDVLVENGH